MATQHVNLWLDIAELQALNFSGPAQQAVWAAADKFAVGSIDLSDQDDKNDVLLLAAALRDGATLGRAMPIVYDGVMRAMDTELGGRTLALGRNLCPVLIAADYAAVKERTFIEWVRRCLHEDLDGRTLISTHEDRPNNWGTHAGASRIACDLYLFKYGSSAERREARADLQRAGRVFLGWLGDRSQYAGFSWGELDWQADPQNPVGINPRGASKDGHSIDGVLPDDQRRAGGFTWPPTKENYVWEALQGAIVQATLLSRVYGLLPFNASNRALHRAVTWLHEECKFPAEGDDTWIPHLVNWAYGSTFPAPIPSSPGKNMGWTDWTHAGRRLQP
jgi:hypothetical protein